MNAAELKEREAATWTRVAPGWRKWDEVLRRGGGPVAERMVDLAGVGAGGRVLDIACGTGEPALTAAERVGPGGAVLGVDFVEPMLTFAREKAARAGLRHVEFRRLDGETLDVPPDAFDAATIRWGLMFMPDPARCLAGVHRALRAGGRAVIACWAEPERNPFVSVPMGVIRQHVELPTPPPGAPGIFAFADAERLRGVIEQAGFRDVSVEEQQVVFAEVASGADGFAMLSDLAGPVAALLATLPPDEVSAIAREVAQTFDGLRADGGIALRGVTWIAAGTK